jgi:predicted short-subunit dehydrogenase-like oxidoreductase (DUF2520 family)
LRSAGLAVLAAHGVSDASRARAARLLPGVPLVEPLQVLKVADLVLLAVPDDALAGLVDGLARHHAFRPGTVVVHTSGRHGLAPLAPARAAGARVLAVHPAMTFTGTSADLPRLPGTSFAVTADESDVDLARQLVLMLGGRPVLLAEQARPLYHAALAHGANHLVTLVSDAMELLAAAGVDDPAGTLRPLLQAALDNALVVGDDALTGPVVRGDAGTVASHLRVIAEAAPSVLPAYRALAQHTATRAVVSGRLRPDDADRVLAALRVDLGPAQTVRPAATEPAA